MEAMFEYQKFHNNKATFWILTIYIASATGK